MDTDLIIKIATAAVVVFGAILGLFQFLTTKRSHVYQNSKTEMELLSQSIHAHEADSDYKTFLTDVRKEKISYLVFGVPIPNADLEQVIVYHRKAEGKVTTGDIAKAWPYRGPSTKPLSFRLSIDFKMQYMMALVYMGLCILAFFWGVVVILAHKPLVKEAITLVSISLIALLFTVWVNRGLFTAVGLAKLEERMSKGGRKGTLPPDISAVK
jgi:hypothetical protein